ncbi:MAG: porphobilinogen synthase [Chloroflexota bacterium]|nr:porphobilinogen synthase [Chloroflexota bacterium]
MRQATLARGRLAEHPIWSRALGRADLAGRVILPVIVGSAVEDREKIEAAPWLERLSVTELVREARTAASAGLAGLLLFGISDRKDEHAFLASEPDHVVPRAIRAVKEAVPELGVATDVCVCAYTAHGQCVLFGEHGADVAATIERLAAIAEVHADAGADLLIPSGMLEGTVGALREALGPRRSDLPISAMVKLESALYVTHRTAVSAIPISERAVPLIPADDAAAAVARARRDMADGADAVIVKPGAPGLDIVARLAAFADRPLFSYFTPDEHAPFVATTDGPLDAAAAEREHLAAARRAGASLVISSGAWSVTES